MTIPGRTGVVLRDPMPWQEFEQVVRAAEDTGYEAVFVPEISGREAFSSLAGLAGGTSRIRLGTGVVTIASRTPEITAMGSATVQDLSGGRFVLGIGAGAGGSLSRMRDYVPRVRSALEKHELVARGNEPPPIWLGALGDRMIRLAGEMADGVILNWCTPERVAQACLLIGRGAEAAGRDPGALTVSVYVRACFGVEVTRALEALRAMTGRYAAIPQYLRQFELMGLGEEASRAAKAHLAGRPEEVPDSLVRAVTVAGGRLEALGRFEAYKEAGADVVLCYPVAALERLSSILGTILTAAPVPALER